MPSASSSLPFIDSPDIISCQAFSFKDDSTLLSTVSDNANPGNAKKLIFKV